jgi:hypothetical protein
MSTNLKPVGTLLIGYGLGLFTTGDKWNYIIGGFVSLLGLALTFNWIREDKDDR